jgi:hypothetical protein
MRLNRYTAPMTARLITTQTSGLRRNNRNPSCIHRQPRMAGNLFTFMVFRGSGDELLQRAARMNML